MKNLSNFVLLAIFFLSTSIFSENKFSDYEYMSIGPQALEIIPENELSKSKQKTYSLFGNEKLKTLVKRVPSEDKKGLAAIKIYVKNGKYYKFPDNTYFLSDYWLKKGSSQISAEEIIKYIITHFNEEGKKSDLEKRCSEESEESEKIEEKWLEIRKPWSPPHDNKTFAHSINAKEMRVRFNLSQIFQDEDGVLAPLGLKKKGRGFSMSDLPIGTAIILDKNSSIQRVPFISGKNKYTQENVKIKGIVTDPNFYLERGLKIPEFSIEEYVVNEAIKSGLSAYLVLGVKDSKKIGKDFKEVTALLDEKPVENKFVEELKGEYFTDDYMKVIPSSHKTYLELKEKFKVLSRYKGKEVTEDDLIDEVCGPDIKNPENLYERFQNEHRVFCAANRGLFYKMRLRGKDETAIPENVQTALKEDYLNFLADRFSKEDFSRIVAAQTIFGEARKGNTHRLSGVKQIMGEMASVLKTIHNRKDAGKGYKYGRGYLPLEKQEYLQGGYEKDRKKIIDPTLAGAVLSSFQYSCWNTHDIYKDKGKAKADPNLLNIISQNENDKSYATISSRENLKLAFKVVELYEKGAFTFDQKDLGSKETLHSHSTVKFDPWDENTGYRIIKKPKVKMDLKNEMVTFTNENGKKVTVAGKHNIVITEHMFAKGVALD